MSSNDISRMEPESDNVSGYKGEVKNSPVSLFNSERGEDLTPCVRYGIVSEGQFSQQNRMVPVEEDPPERAKFASPIVYMVSSEQSQRLYDGTPPKTIQKECERDNRAFFRVVAESDALEDSVEGEEVADWLKEFAEEYIETEDYQILYSGNRSLHLHTGKWVSYDQLGKLKSLVEAFNRETDGELDTSLYTSIPQFRLTGAKHNKTGLYKVPIESDFSRANLIRQSQSEPEKDTITRESPYYAAGDANTEALSTKIGDRLLYPYIKETAEVEDQFPGKPFSPYALTGDGDYSVCIFSHHDLIEKGDKDYARGYVFQAEGGDGHYTRYNSWSKVRLSGHDSRKWDFDKNDNVVIIGGRSRQSKFLGITQDETAILQNELKNESRDVAIDTLQRWGYDTGERGPKGDTEARTSEETEASRLKNEIDSGRRSPGYEDIFRVSCRLLKIEGWEAAWQWLQRTFGEDFDPEDSYDRIKTIVETYDDSFEDISIPLKEDVGKDDLATQNDI